MNYYELICTAFLQNDIYYDQINESIGRTINRAMYLEKELKELHGATGFKHYVYDNFYPREVDKNYKKGRIYIFKIRSIDKDILIKMSKVLPQVKESNIKIVSTEIKEYRQKHITELYTVTPAVLTIEDRYWTKGDSFQLLERRIQENLEKKYKDFFKKPLDIQDSFIQGIEMKNDKAIGVGYKKGQLIGNKFRILIKEDRVSQKLAVMALATGILEKNASNGMGFCVSK